MRIGLISDGIPPLVMGGMQKHSLLLAKYLAQEGVEVIIYHPGDLQGSGLDPIKLFSEEERRNIRLIEIPYIDDKRYPGHYLHQSWNYSKRVHEHLLHHLNDVEFIYAKGFAGWKTVVERKAGRLNIPVGVKFHGMNMFQVQPNWKGEIIKHMFRKPVRSIMKGSDVVFSYGGKITDIIKEQGILENKIIEIPSGIEKGWLRTPQSLREYQHPISFLFIGRFDRLKGLPEIYKAIKELDREDFKLRIVGPIPEKERIEHDDRMEYTGPIQDQEVLKTIIDQNQVLLCPSVSEGMPNVILEAMSRGLAIIATDVGANRLLVDQTNGALLADHSPEKIRNALEAFIGMDANQVMKLGKASIRRIEEHFLWEKIGKETKRKISEFVNGK